MCLPCGSSLGLTNAASKHSPSAVLRRRPCGSLSKGERPGGWAPGGRLPWELPAFSLLLVADRRWRTLPSVLCVMGWGRGGYKGRLETFSFLSFSFKNPFHSIPFLENHNPPSSLPSPSVLKNSHFVCYPLLLWICFEQQLLSV